MNKWDKINYFLYIWIILFIKIIIIWIISFSVIEVGFLIGNFLGLTVTGVGFSAVTFSSIAVTLPGIGIFIGLFNSVLIAFGTGGFLTSAFAWNIPWIIFSLIPKLISYFLLLPAFLSILYTFYLMIFKNTKDPSSFLEKSRRTIFTIVGIEQFVAISRKDPFTDITLFSY